MLTKEHTKHGGLGRVFTGQLGKAHAGTCPRVDEQSLSALGGAELKENFIPFGLHNFFNSAAQSHGADLMHHAGEHSGVKGH